MRTTLVAVLALTLAGCAQNSLGGGEPDGGGASSSGASAGVSSGSASSAGASSGSATTSTGGSSSGAGCSSTPTIACAMVDAGNQVLAGQTVEIDCTSPQSNLTWGVVASLSGAAVQNRLMGSGGQAYVTFESTALPVYFADTQVMVTVSASACGASSAGATQTVSFNLVGNLLAIDNANNTIDAYTSDGSLRGDFIGPTLLNQPSMVVRLNDGTILAGGIADASHPGLVHTDAQGNPLAAWDTTDHTNTPLWSSMVVPSAAAEDATGVVWVAAASMQSVGGVIHRFSASGSYQDDAPVPTDDASAFSVFSPVAVATLPGGDVVVADSGVSSPVVVRYPANGAAPTHVPLGFELCSDPENGNAPSCAGMPYPWGGPTALLTVGDTLLVAINNQGEAMVGQFDGELRFLLSTAEPGSGDSERGYGNTIFDAIAVSGDVVVASAGYLNCMLTLSSATLYDPNPNANNYTCWAPFDSISGAESMVHLSR